MADSGSRFADCPSCGKRVALLLMNDHLDGGCLDSFSTARKKTKPNHPPQELPPPPPPPATHLRSLHDVLKPQRSAAFDSRAKYRPSPLAEWRIVNDDELPHCAPLTLVRDVLPSMEATALLRRLQADSSQWNRGSWMIFNQKRALPRTSCWYELADGDVGSEEEEEDGERSYVNVRATCAVPDELRAAAAAVEAIVRRLRPSLAWHATGALANRYADGEESVAAHSDQLGMLGPRPVIVGLSLGASRRFDLSETVASGSNAGSGGAALQLMLPHNSCLIMWDDAQERWTHAVPRCAESAIGRHPISGLERISLTFRMCRSMPKLPDCNCGEPAALRCFGGVYMLICDPSRTRAKAGGAEKHCGFRQRCEWAEREAARLRSLSCAERAEAMAEAGK